jgi:hypothetical protein
MQGLQLKQLLVLHGVCLNWGVYLGAAAVILAEGSVRVCSMRPSWGVASHLCQAVCA